MILSPLLTPKFDIIFIKNSPTLYNSEVINKNVVRGAGTPNYSNMEEHASMIIYSLYVKTHNFTGLKYLGYTKSKDPHRYKGSGVYWTRHLAKHGNYVTTEILHETTDKQEIEKLGVYYSQLWDVVASSEWANLILENGKGASLISAERRATVTTLIENAI